MERGNIIPYAEHHWESYQRFAKREWGETTYQATPAYIRWLYQENPSPFKKISDFLLVTSETDEVVGCVHKLRMPWRLDTQHIEIPTIHNLAVDTPYRARFGLPLILKSLRTDEYGIVPGTAPPQSDIFEKLKCQPIPVSWHRKILRPLSGSVQLAAGKLGWRCQPRYFSEEPPSLSLLTKMAETLQKRSRGFRLSPYWDPAWLAWRYFHPTGPKHLLIHQETQTDDELDFIILSLGPRRGLNVARIVELSVNDELRLKQLLKRAASSAKQHGAHVFLTFFPGSTVDKTVASHGFKPLSLPAKTFFYFRDKACHFNSFCLSAAATDFGLEAIRSEP